LADKTQILAGKKIGVVLGQFIEQMKEKNK